MCGSAVSSKTIGIKSSFEWERCRQCHLHYVRTEDHHLDEYYKDYYGDDSPVVPDSVRNRLDQLVQSFEPYRSLNRVLDVGFGAGWLLRAAAEQGWSCWGTELAMESIRVARVEGWQVSQADLPDSELPPGHFDVITLVEVLEHLPDPLAYLKETTRLLRPGGLLYGTTPNARGVNARILGLDWTGYSAPEHLQLFSPRALRYGLASAGLDLIHLRAEGFNPFELLARRRHRPTGIDRVEAAYALNERMLGTGSRRAVKSIANHVLSRTRLGDSLKVYAVRRSIHQG